jgi:hypothetical protein
LYTDESKFFHFGPSAELKSAGILIDTWMKWAFLMFLVCVTQSVKVCADETISPWIINNVMDDDKDILTDITPFEIQGMCQLYYFFSAIVSFINVVIYTTQIDFVLALVLIDLLVSFFTTRHYIQKKKSFFHDSAVTSRATSSPAIMIPFFTTFYNPDTFSDTRVPLQVSNQATSI